MELKVIIDLTRTQRKGKANHRRLSYRTALHATVAVKFFLIWSLAVRYLRRALAGSEYFQGSRLPRTL